MFNWCKKIGTFTGYDPEFDTRSVNKLLKLKKMIGWIKKNKRLPKHRVGDVEEQKHYNLLNAMKKGKAEGSDFFKEEYNTIINNEGLIGIFDAKVVKIFSDRQKKSATPRPQPRTMVSGLGIIRVKKGRYKSPNRKNVNLSRDVLIDYIIENELTSVRKLYSFRKPEDPHINDYRKVFGSWQNAIDIAFGKKECASFVVTHESIINIILQFDIWRVVDYKNLRKERPDIIPPFHKISSLFGSFAVLKRISVDHRARLICEEFLKLKISLGREPSDEDIRLAEIDVTKAYLIIGGGRSGLNTFIKKLEKYYENNKESKLGKIGLGFYKIEE